MARQPIVKILDTDSEGNRKLEAASWPATKLNRALINDLMDTMADSGAVGLAAPQIGVFERVAVIKPSLFGGERLALINPKIIASSDKLIWSYEGCASIDNIGLWVPRLSEVQVSYISAENRREIRSFSHFGARVVQHEIDHLNGITILDRQQNPERKQAILDRLETRGLIGAELDSLAYSLMIQPAYGEPFRMGAQSLALTVSRGSLPAPSLQR